MSSKTTYKAEEKISLSDAWRAFKSEASSALAKYSRKEPVGDANTLPPNIGWGVIPVEIYESGDNLVVDVEVAGMKSEDFDITVMNNALYVEGHKQGRKDTSGGVYHTSERAYGYFCRQIPMPVPVDETQVTASYTHGILSVTLPKVASAFCRRIEVQGE